MSGLAVEGGFYREARTNGVVRCIAMGTVLAENPGDNWPCVVFADSRGQIFVLSEAEFSDGRYVKARPHERAQWEKRR